jgi:hypothetical protein
MVGLSVGYVDGKAMVGLRRFEGSVLARVVKSPWLPPALAIVVVGAAAQLGSGWLFGTLSVVTLCAVAAVVGLCVRGDRSIKPATVDWQHEVLRELEHEWEGLAPLLTGITPEEYGWDAATDVLAGAPWPETTIAWHLEQLGLGVLGVHASRHFGDQSLTPSNVRRPAGAEEAVAALEVHYRHWLHGIQAIHAGEAGKSRPASAQINEPSAAVVLRVNQQVAQHGARIAILRELYQARKASPSGR